MELNISQIVADKIKEMEDSGALKKKIEDNIEKTINESIDEALHGYSFKNQIEKSIKAISEPIAAEIGFTAYNQFIVDKMKQLMQVEVRADIAAKVEKAMTDIFIKRHDGIKLSEIFDKYREWVKEEVEEDDQRERETFICNIEEEDKTYESSCKYYKVRFHDRPLNAKRKAFGVTQDTDIKFNISQYKDETGTIYCIYLEGYSPDQQFSLRHINDFEALILNLYYNHTPIIMDLEEIDPDDNCFEIGY